MKSTSIMNYVGSRVFFFSSSENLGPLFFAF